MNKRQLLFLNAYLETGNASQSALAAGYSAKTAYSHGQRLLKHVEMQKEIEAFQKELKSKATVTVERVLQELSAIAFHDVSDYVDFDGTTVKIKPFKDIPKGKRVAISEITQSTTLYGTNTKMKFHDKQRALEAIGRHLGMSITAQELIDKMNDQQIEELTDKILSRINEKK